MNQQDTFFNIFHNTNWGNPEESAETFRWFRNGVSEGIVEARYWVGYCYFLGCGIPKDVSQAKECFNEAASEGHVKSQEMLISIEKLDADIWKPCKTKEDPKEDSIEGPQGPVEDDNYVSPSEDDDYDEWD